MSQDSEDIGAPVKRMWAAFSARNWTAFAEEFDPEVEYTPVEEQTVYRGPEGCTEYAHQWLDAWDTFSAQVEETESAPTPNRVFARIRLRGRGRGSGVEIEEGLFWVAELRRGRIYRISEYNNRYEALEAAGLSEQAVSQENVEVVRRGIEAWNAGDMDALRETYDPNAVLRTAEGWPEPGPYVGREAVMRQFEQARGTWDADAIEVVGDIIHAADRVVLRSIWRGVGRGPESNMELTAVYTVRNGRVLYQEFFWDYAQALEAVGLSEQDTHAES